jgi:hypothetical protein
MGEWRYRHLDLGTRWRWVVSFMPRERALSTHWIRGWTCPRASLDVEKRKKILPLSGICPAHWYTYWAIPTPFHYMGPAKLENFWCEKPSSSICEEGDESMLCSDLYGMLSVDSLTCSCYCTDHWLVCWSWWRNDDERTVTPLTNILEMPSSSLGQGANYLHRDFSWFSSVPSGKCWDNTVSFHILTNLLITIYPAI